MKQSLYSKLKILTLFCFLLYGCKKGTFIPTTPAGTNPAAENFRVQISPGNIAINLPVNAVVVSASAAYSNGRIPSIVLTQWRKISGPSNYSIVSPDNLQTRIENLVIGNYTFQCKITDHDGKSDSALTSISVIDTGSTTHPPRTLVVGINPFSSETCLPMNSINAEINAWYVEGGTPFIHSVQWRKIAGPANYSVVQTSNLTARIENLSAGTYVFECIATDLAGKSDSTKTVVSVCDTTSPPQQVTFYDQQWIDTGFGMYFKINLSQYLAGSNALKEVYLKTDCVTSPFRIYNISSAPPTHSYTYFLEYLNNIVWLHIGYYNTGPDQCTLPTDTPDLFLIFQ